MLDILNLHVVYGTGRLRVDAVRDLSFRVEPGGSYGLVGESGSGKSTVLRAICGLADRERPIWWTAARRRPPRDKAFYRTVQMVFQDPYASLPPPHGRRDALRAARHPWERNVGGAHPAGLAGGGTGPLLPSATRTSSRAASASASPSHALILRPKVLLLDEPTSALDASVQAEILNLLDHLRARARAHHHPGQPRPRRRGASVRSPARDAQRRGRGRDGHGEPESRRGRERLYAGTHSCEPGIRPLRRTRPGFRP